MTAWLRGLVRRPAGALLNLVTLLNLLPACAPPGASRLGTSAGRAIAGAGGAHPLPGSKGQRPLSPIQDSQPPNSPIPLCPLCPFVPFVVNPLAVLPAAAGP